MALCNILTRGVEEVYKTDQWICHYCIYNLLLMNKHLCSELPNSIETG